MKTLHLTMKKKWFDMIDSGKKPEEYRDITPYWVRRLIDIDKSLDESKGESKITPDDICYDILVNGHDPEQVLKAYRSKFKEFDQVFARNGYNPKNQSWLRNWEGIRIGVGEEAWGAPPRKVFIIKLGDKIV